MAYENPNVRWEYPQAEQNPWLQLYPNALNIYGVPSLRETPRLSSQNYYDRLPSKEKEKLQNRWTAFNDKHLRGAIAPTFNWANKKALFTVGQNQYDSKTMPLISEGNQIYGIGLANYNWTPRNIHRQVDTIRKNKDEKAGGQKQLWNYWNKWIDSRGWSNKRKNALKTYLTTGDAAGVRMDDILMMSDAGLRETARHQQHKSDWISRTWDAITSPKNWMNAALAYNTGNPQWTHRTIQGVTSDMRGSPDGQQDQYGTVDEWRNYDPSLLDLRPDTYGQDETPDPKTPASPKPDPNTGQIDLAEWVRLYQLSQAAQNYGINPYTHSPGQAPANDTTAGNGTGNGTGTGNGEGDGEGDGEEEDPVTVEMNPYVTRRSLQAIIQRGQQEEEERKRLMHRLGEYSPTFAQRGLIQPVQPIRSRLLG